MKLQVNRSLPLYLNPKGVKGNRLEKLLVLQISSLPEQTPFFHSGLVVFKARCTITAQGTQTTSLSS